MAAPPSRQFALSEFGISFESNKTFFDKSIKYSYAPQFGYPLQSFDDMKEAFDGIIYQDSSKTWEENPFAIIRSTQFQQLASLLVLTKLAQR